MDWYSEIKINGFHRFNDPKAFTYLEWYYRMPLVKYQTAKYPIFYYPIGKWLLRKTQKKLKQLYISNFKSEYGIVDAWRGVDKGTDEWHNDMPDGSNIAFLMYLSDMDESTGGGLQFRQQHVSGVKTVYPKKYDIIVLDQDLKFTHRVLPLIKPINRDIANIEFNILEEWNDPQYFSN